jgi:F-type H+-transporting ATPase subunit epsilon
MTHKVNLKIVTPEKLILEELVDQVSLPTTKGEITVLPNHIPLITELASGEIVGCVNNECIPVAVVGGFVEIKNNAEGITEVAILADFAEHVGDLSDEKIQNAKDYAEVLKKKIHNKEDIDFEHFETMLERSITQSRVASKWSSKRYRK